MWTEIYQIVLAFGAGVLTSLTPCVYPMIPITIGILQAHAKKSVLHNFLISISYVLGISLVYSILGYVAATTAAFFGQWVSNPWVVGIVILFFIYLAFSMFGFYELYIPNFLHQQRDIQIKGSCFYSFLFGIFAGLVASPCLTPALAMLMAFVSSSASPVFGFFLLFSFAFGMGLLLIVIGTFSTMLYLIPRAGFWMNDIKNFFGFILIAMSIYFLRPFLSLSFSLKLYSIIFIIGSFYYFATARNRKIRFLFGILFAVIAVIFLIKGMRSLTTQ